MWQTYRYVACANNSNRYLFGKHTDMSLVITSAHPKHNGPLLLLFVFPATHTSAGKGTYTAINGWALLYSTSILWYIQTTI